MREHAAPVNAPTLADLDRGRDNNLDFLRLAAASAVIFGHSYNLLGRSDPLLGVLAMGTGRLAVAVFFCLSGYLVAGSLIRRRSLVEFTLARALRIYPGLIAANSVVVLVAGVALTTHSAASYFTSKATWWFLLVNSTTIKTVAALPGVFTDNPVASNVNGSLWTLPVEVRMYALVLLCGIVAAVGAAVGAAGRRVSRERLLPWALAAAFAAAYALSATHWRPAGKEVVVLGAPNALVLVPYFAAGALFCLARERVKLVGWAAAVAIALSVTARGTALSQVITPAAISYACLYLGYSRRIRLRGFARYGDFSFGMYIYAFPIQQTIYAHTAIRSPLLNALIAWALSLAVAAASWHLVERRALAFKDRLTAQIRARRTPQEPSPTRAAETEPAP